MTQQDQAKRQISAASQIAVPTENPFANDCLQLSEFAKNLTRLVSNVSSPVVISLSSPWGTGKTCFLRMWKQQLINEGFPVFSFNAWENDFIEDPLIAFVAELQGSIEKSQSFANKLPNSTDALSKLRPLVGRLARGAARISAAHLTRGVSEKLLDDWSNGSAIAADLGTLAGEIVEEQIKAAAANQSLIQRFRDCVTNFAGTDDDKPFVVLVDELDRCRPTFAVDLLERIKHLFAVENVVFILGVDREQLASSAAAVFGPGFKGDGYLRRFIDMDIRLPAPNAEAFCLFQIRRHSLSDSPFEQSGQILSEEFAGFAARRDLSLRVQEQCFTQIAAIQHLHRKNWSWWFADLLVFSIVLRNVAPALSDGILSLEADWSEVRDFLVRSPADRPLWRVTGVFLSLLSQSPSARSFISSYQKANNSGGVQDFSDAEQRYMNVFHETRLDLRQNTSGEIERLLRFAQRIS